MKLNVANEIKQPGKTAAFCISEMLEPQSYLGGEIRFQTPLTIEGSCCYDGEAFSVIGEARTVLDSTCARCNKQFNQPFKFAFEERFVQNPGEEDECYPFRGDELDLSQMVMDNLFLHLPVFSVCSEDCKGLCPVCGCDLNTAQCSCARGTEHEKENPLAALAELLNHDKEV